MFMMLNNFGNKRKTSRGVNATSIGSGIEDIQKLLKESENRIQSSLLTKLEQMFTEKMHPTLEQIKLDNKATLPNIQNHLNIFEEEIKDVKTSLQFLSDRCDEIDKEIKLLKKGHEDIKRMKEDIQATQSDMDQLYTYIQNLEQ